MSEIASKFKSALQRIVSHAADDHNGDIKENILSIFDSLTKQEKIAILGDVVDRHLGEDSVLDNDRGTIKTQLELMQAKDELKKNRQTRVFFIIATGFVIFGFMLFVIKAIFSISNPSDPVAFFETAAQLLGVIFGNE